MLPFTGIPHTHGELGREILNSIAHPNCTVCRITLKPETVIRVRIDGMQVYLCLECLTELNTDRTEQGLTKLKVEIPLDSVLKTLNTVTEH